jgi:hypothetical protein
MKAIFNKRMQHGNGSITNNLEVSCRPMNRMKSTPAEWRLVVILFLLVLIVFTLAERDSKRLERLYTSFQSNKKENVVLNQKTSPASLPKR